MIKFIVTLELILLLFPSHVSGVGATRCLSKQVAAQPCDCIAGPNMLKYMNDFDCNSGFMESIPDWIPHPKIKDCKLASAACSRASINNVNACLKLPELPGSEEVCQCKNGECFKEGEATKPKRREACCKAVHYCWKVKLCSG